MPPFGIHNGAVAAEHACEKRRPGVTLYAAPIRGKLLQLLSHHIIYGEIVVFDSQQESLPRAGQGKGAVQRGLPIGATPPPRLVAPHTCSKTLAPLIHLVQHLVHEVATHTCGEPLVPQSPCASFPNRLGLATSPRVGD